MAPKKKKEKLSHQFCWTCATGTIALVGVASYMAGIDLTHINLSLEDSRLLEQLGNTSLSRQLKVVYLGLPSAAILSMLGYIMGDILDNPRGKIPESVLEDRKKAKEAKSKTDENKPSPMITGDELFLDDLDFGDDMLSGDTASNNEFSDVPSGV